MIVKYVDKVMPRLLFETGLYQIKFVCHSQEKLIIGSFLEIV